MGALENNNHQNSLFTHFYTIVYALIVHDNAAVCMYYVMCVCVCVCVRVCVCRLTRSSP